MRPKKSFPPLTEEIYLPSCDKFYLYLPNLRLFVEPLQPSYKRRIAGRRAFFYRPVTVSKRPVPIANLRASDNSQPANSREHTCLIADDCPLALLHHSKDCVPGRKAFFFRSLPRPRHTGDRFAAVRNTYIKNFYYHINQLQLFLHLSFGL